MPRFRNVNGINVQLTAEEEADLAISDAQGAIDAQAEKDAIAQWKIDKENGKKKLLGLGLTLAEVDSLIG